MSTRRSTRTVVTNAAAKPAAAAATKGKRKKDTTEQKAGSASDQGNTGRKKAKTTAAAASKKGQVRVSQAADATATDGAAADATATDGAAADAAATDGAAAEVDLQGKRFVVMGGFTMGKWKVESAITEAGGTLTKAVAKSVSYVICGTPVDAGYGNVSGPGSKAYREAKKLKIPILDETAFEALIAANSAHQTAQLQNVSAGLIPDLSNIVAGFVGESEGPGAVWLDICRMKGVPDPKGCTTAEISAVEDKIKLALPPYLKSLLKVANGSGSEHPRNIFPTLLDIDTNNRAGSIAALFRERKYKYLSLGEQDQNEEDFIDLKNNSGSIVTICIEPDCEEISHRQLSIPERIEAYHTMVKATVAALQKRIDVGVAKGRTELQVLREFINPDDRTRAPAAPAGGESAEEKLAREEAWELSRLRAVALNVNEDVTGCEPVALHARNLARTEKTRDRAQAAAEAVRVAGGDESAAAAAGRAAAATKVEGEQLETYSRAGHRKMEHYAANAIWKLVYQFHGAD